MCPQPCFPPGVRYPGGGSRGIRRYVLQYVGTVAQVQAGHIFAARMNTKCKSHKIVKILKKILTNKNIQCYNKVPRREMDNAKFFGEKK